MQLPDAIVLQCELSAESFIEFARLAVETLNSIGLPNIVGWYRGGARVVHHEGFDAALAEIEKMRAPHFPTITLLFPQDSTIKLSFNMHTNVSMVRASMVPDSPTKEAVRDLLGKLIGYLKRLLDSGDVVEAAVWRQEGETNPLPYVPLVRPTEYGVIVTQNAVEERYEGAEEFWKSGWVEIQAYGDKKLLLRATKAATGAEFLAAVQPQQRGLARIARPRLTIHSGIEPRDEEERAIYFSGPPKLRVTIYLEDEQTLVLTCTVEPYEHIQGWEIDRLCQILRAGKLEDGRIIKAIRVIFPDEQSARREKRPLLDVGAQVQYMDSHGDLISIIE